MTRDVERSNGPVLWLKTFGGAALVYATVPLLAIVWTVGKVARVLRFAPLRVGALVAFILAAGAVYWLFGSSGKATDPVAIQVTPGTTFAALTDSLSRREIIRNPLLFRAAARLGGLDRNLHVGLYAFAPQDSPYRILNQLAGHRQIYLQFTIVEGAVLRNLLPRLSEELALPFDSLRAVASDPNRVAMLGVATDDLEGYLFPETYTVPWGADAPTAIDATVSQFHSVWKRVSRGYTGELSRHEAVTLASLIEAEARDGDERVQISSVFHNRLKRRMRLQCDPTVIYAMGGLDRPLLRKDWQYESPYNTYIVAGLPPGPICSPGEASLRAALYPDSTDYLYFVARGDGTHAFSRTLAEHEAADREIKQRLKAESKSRRGR